MKSSIKKAHVVGFMLLVLPGVAFGVASIQEQTKPEQSERPCIVRHS